MHVRVAAFAAVAGLGVVIGPAHAAGAKPQIVDATGDANGVNQQIPGFGPDPSVQTAPAEVAGADITTVRFTTTFATKKVKHKTVRVPNGFTVTMALAAAPVPNVDYRVSGTIGGCAGVQFEYSTATLAPGPQARCPGTTPATDSHYVVSGRISGSSVVWTVPNGVFHDGTVFSSLNAQTRTIVGVVTAPQIDYATSSATYTVGK